jgi:hypothetical protein
VQIGCLTISPLVWFNCSVKFSWRRLVTEPAWSWAGSCSSYEPFPLDHNFPVLVNLMSIPILYSVIRWFQCIHCVKQRNVSCVLYTIYMSSHVAVSMGLKHSVREAGCLPSSSPEVGTRAELYITTPACIFVTRYCSWIQRQLFILYLTWHLFGLMKTLEEIRLLRFIPGNLSVRRLNAY